MYLIGKAIYILRKGGMKTMTNENNVTTNLELPQWVAGGQPHFLDKMNEAYQKIDEVYREIQNTIDNLYFYLVEKTTNDITLKSGVTISNLANGALNFFTARYQPATSMLNLSFALYPNNWTGLKRFVLNGTIDGVSVYAYPVFQLPITSTDANKVLDVSLKGSVSEGYDCFFCLAIEDGNLWLCLYFNTELGTEWKPEKGYGMFGCSVLLKEFMENVGYSAFTDKIGGENV